MCTFFERGKLGPSEYFNSNSFFVTSLGSNGKIVFKTPQMAAVKVNNISDFYDRLPFRTGLTFTPVL